ncbi:hypothetical protein DNTS_024399 [Danionella cerebrum]|uniref:PID domain-containing protein n=1 Tax=Danionella cerebrum TaxID=2873325 RepID=A0A553RKH0_9TELE|nr:hypothetical protein DNTS_024399 [Danionella translucida]
MNKLRQSFRRKKDVYVPESSRPHQWQTDEEAVRSGKCSFAVKLLFLEGTCWWLQITDCAFDGIQFYFESALALADYREAVLAQYVSLHPSHVDTSQAAPVCSTRGRGRTSCVSIIAGRSLTSDFPGDVWARPGAVFHWSSLSWLFPLMSAATYLGHVEVDESRGMHICEEAVKKLKTQSSQREASTSFLLRIDIPLIEEQEVCLLPHQPALLYSSSRLCLICYPLDRKVFKGFFKKDQDCSLKIVEVLLQMVDKAPINGIEVTTAILKDLPVLQVLHRDCQGLKPVCMYDRSEIVMEPLSALPLTGKKAVRAVLWVSADGLRVVDDKTKDLILDQTIEKVSFCAPDRNFEHAFSYICRDGTTRRWICHCFMALKDSGERLSHAVGCAFAACLERKQKREKECGVTATFDANRTTFTREGSFRVTTATEQVEREEVMRQLQDCKKDSDVIVLGGSSSGGALNPGLTLGGPNGSSPSPPPLPMASLAPQDANPHIIPRRHAPVEALARQGSFRGFPALSQKTSPFKRQMSLRMNELPSTMQRRSGFPLKNTVAEVEGEADSISSLCTQITSTFSGPTEDPFSSAPMPRASSSPQSPCAPANGIPPAFPPPSVTVTAAANPLALPPPLPVRETNPWAKTPSSPVLTHAESEWVSPPPAPAAPPAPASATLSPPAPSHKRTPSEADRWLEEVSKSVRGHPTSSVPLPPGSSASPFISSSAPVPPIPSVPFIPSSVPAVPPRQPAFHAQAPASFPLSNGIPYTPASFTVVGITPSQMVAHVFGSAQTQSASIPVPQAQLQSSPFSTPPQFDAHSLSAQLPAQFDAQPPFGKPPIVPSAPVIHPLNVNGTRVALQQQQADPFDAQWAALESRTQQQRTVPSPTNPFSSELHKTFEIQL